MAKTVRRSKPPTLEPLHKTSLVLPTSLWKQAKVRCLNDGVDLRDFIIAAMREKLAKGGR